MEEHAQFPDALQGPVEDVMEEAGGGDGGLGEGGGGGGGGGEGGERDGGDGKGDGGGGLGEGVAMHRSTESHCGGQTTLRAEGRAFELR